MPPTLKKLAIGYSGVYQGDFFDVVTLDDKVLTFDVVYQGKAFDGTVLSTRISLAQAVRIHSSSGPGRPRFARARGEQGRPYGIVDVDNLIYYLTNGPMSPSSTVFSVGYLQPDAPVLQTPDEDMLAPSYVDSLWTTGGAAPVKSVRSDLPPLPGSHSFRTRNEALAALTGQADRVIGRGKRTLALITKAETWMEVDENHESARETFRLLRQFRRDFDEEMVTFVNMYRANEKILRPGDTNITRLPLELNDQIKHGMAQLAAMGFHEYVPSE